MTNDDVREAFNICVSGGENPDCDTCPYKDIYDYRECFIVLRRHALELINRQKAEIERLQKYNTDVAFKHYNDGRVAEQEEVIKVRGENSALQLKNSMLQHKNIELQHKIDELQDRNRKCIYLSDDETTEYCVDAICPQFKTEGQIKAEAIKEFAERLKECCYHNDDLSNDDCLSITSDINCILKEMVGDNDESKI